MQPKTIDELAEAHTPLQNPDGTENTEAVDAVNNLAEELAQMFAVPPTGARRRRTYRRRRRDVRRTRYVRRR
jgi:hypothetical protein